MTGRIYKICCAPVLVLVFVYIIAGQDCGPAPGGPVQVDTTTLQPAGQLTFKCWTEQQQGGGRNRFRQLGFLTGNTELQLKKKSSRTSASDICCLLKHQLLRWDGPANHPQQNAINFGKYNPDHVRPTPGQTTQACEVVAECGARIAVHPAGSRAPSISQNQLNPQQILR